MMLSFFKRPQIMIITVFIIVAIKAIFRRQPSRLYRAKNPQKKQEQFHKVKVRKKPDWVIHEVLKIKSQSPDLSCRLIAHVFNKRFAHKGISVGKTFVSYTIRDNLYKIQVLRKKWKSQKPHEPRFNHYWGMDITFVDNKPILGVTEHHSRKLIGLIPLSDKSTINIIKQLIRLIRYSTQPKIIRVDNEACFNSKGMKLFLKMLGIKHQTIEKHCPWQNGRIERLFGTLKSSIRRMGIAPDELPLLCYDFQQWYNVIRPHQSLNGKRLKRFTGNKFGNNIDISHY